MIKKYIILMSFLLTVVLNYTVKAEDNLLQNKAYSGAKQNILPLSTDQIMDFLDKYKTSQEASVEGQKIDPEKRVRIENIPLDPGANIPTVYVAQGFVSTISFLDATSSGWPIVDVVSGGNFTITPPEQNGHIIRVSPNVRYGYGNLSVRLKGLDFPITLNVEVNDKMVDYRFDAKIPMLGPDGKIDIISSTNVSSAGDSMLSGILEGVIPEGMKKLEIISGDIDNTTIYQKGDSIFIRTNATLLSPRWKTSASISEGLKVYTVKASPVLLFSKNGEIIKIKVNLLKEER